MSRTILDIRLSQRTPFWKWSVCGLLFLATTINYMDRMTLTQMAVPIKTEFALDERQYGQLESAFGSAFALGAILFGWVADCISVRWLYPAAVLAWSLAGFATGLVRTYDELLLCRFLLGLAEAGNWSCALRTTQRILRPEERTLGNGILQSGAAIGAVLTPLVVVALLHATGSWRPAFLCIGALGLGWAAIWVVIVRTTDLPSAKAPLDLSLVLVLGWLIGLYGIDLFVHWATATDTLPQWVALMSKCAATLLGITGIVVWLIAATRNDTALPRRVFLRRFAALAVLVVAINATWHFFRVWMPLFLDSRGYGVDDYQYFSVGYYLSTDIGSLSAGLATFLLARHGLSVHGSRMVVFAVCGALTLLSIAAAVLPPGPLLVAVLLVVGFGALGVFPSYYSFTQDLTVEHQGKLTGALGCICWLAMALVHEVVGDVVKRTGSYTHGVAAAGTLPLLGLVAMLVLWGRTPQRERPPVADQQPLVPHPEGVRRPAHDLSAVTSGERGGTSKASAAAAVKNISPEQRGATPERQARSD
jgi:ACS family hexuronate transporter-like MFS transporter